MTLPDHTYSGHPPTAAVLTRVFGWTVLAVMAAFILNVVLTFFVKLPGAALILRGGAGDVSAWGWAQFMLYGLLPGAAAAYVARTRRRTLRADACTISAANGYLLRAAFWAVVIVGLSDAVISFLRVEGLLVAVAGSDLASDLSRSAYRGLHVHLPAIAAGALIACFGRTPGFHWLALLVVLAELLIVFSRFVFSYEQAFMADLVRLWYAALFLLASAYTMREDGHVRVDVLYAGFSRRGQGRINAWGAVVLGMTVAWTVLLVGMWSPTGIINAPLLIFETTLTGFGMQTKYLLAGLLGVFAVTMLIEFVASLFEAVADMRGDPGGREDHHVGAVA
ncbi:Tripartite ATP-independent transporter, DctQ component [Roseovarius azorensis]|uniref:TRAP transporter small permease protein n=1 Tax=Roseovarius azorensis TaxID=1287727 RepID=A0A1H7QHP3_9RHOB|nr:TRAP transporter small permease subunit [Roseovarius azorensis]SEL47075.1 Tripartite ATP-independent transporter, DctQ component [Roseovarius azorensis]